MSHDDTDRMSRLRHELVATVDAARYSRPQSRSRLVVAAIAAFALAGAATGGAISATATSASHTTLSVDADSLARTLLGANTPLYGTPVILSGRGSTSIELGEPPAGATSIAVALTCLDAGEFSIAVDGEADGSSSCAPDDTGSSFGFGSSSAQQHPVRGPGTHSVTVDSGGSSRYAVWVSWSAVEALPQPSAAQLAELADGAASRDEYLAAFDRFSACMTAAGEPLMGVDVTDTPALYRVSNRSVELGIDNRCYWSEFRLVDTSWQGAH